MPGGVEGNLTRGNTTMTAIPTTAAYASPILNATAAPVAPPVAGTDATTVAQPLVDVGGTPTIGNDAGSSSGGAIAVRRAAASISYELRQAIEHSFGSDAMESQAELAAFRSPHSSHELVSMLDSVEGAFGDDTVELRLFERAARGSHSASEVDGIIRSIDDALSSDAMEEGPALGALGSRVLSASDVDRIVDAVEGASSADEYESRILSAAFHSGRSRADIISTIDRVERRYSDDASEADALVRAFGGVGGPTSPGDDGGYDPGNGGYYPGDGGYYPGNGGYDPTYPTFPTYPTTPSYPTTPGYPTSPGDDGGAYPGNGGFDPTYPDTGYPDTGYPGSGYPGGTAGGDDYPG